MTIRDNFDRAAATYDQFADVQAEVAERLAALLPARAAPARIVELGCGTGNFTTKLQRRFPAARIIAVDFACRMLARAAARMRDTRVQFVCQDIEGFVLALSSGVMVDQFVSNATLQWLPDLRAVLAGLHGHLHPGGILLFSFFGPETLSELQQALDAALPGKAHLAAGRFKNRKDIRRLLDRNFKVELEEEVVIRRSYDSVLTLLRQIGKTGTGGAHPRPLRLSRGNLQTMDDWFAVRHGGCLTGYQVFFYRCRA